MSGQRARILVVGAGPVGQTLASGLAAAGHEVRAVRRLPAGLAGGPAGAVDIAVLAVRDDAIAQVAAQAVAEGLVGQRTVLLHCAGALAPLAVLKAHADVAGRGLLHPLRSLPAPLRPAELAGTVMAVCGDAGGLAAAAGLARDLAAHPLVLTEAQLPAYHAAAVLAAGQVAALLDVAIGVLQAVGLPRREAEQALGALCRGVADNVVAAGLPAALTGPAARGDVATVARHLATLPAISPEAAQLYRALLPAALRLAAQRGAPAQALDQMAALLTDHSGSG